MNGRAAMTQKYVWVKKNEMRTSATSWKSQQANTCEGELNRIFGTEK